MRVYLDTSAAVKLLVAEPESAALTAQLDQPGLHVVSSDLLETELGRVAVRGGLPASDVATVLSRIDLATPDRSTYRHAAWLSHPTLRSLDALHIAAAIGLNADAILTYDQRMIDACHALGVSVLTPLPDGTPAA